MGRSAEGVGFQDRSVRTFQGLHHMSVLLLSLSEQGTAGTSIGLRGRADWSGHSLFANVSMRFSHAVRQDIYRLPYLP